jgi:hypothetical protein
MNFQTARHTWRCVSNDSGDTVIEMSTSLVRCSDVIEEFSRYLLGVGFFHANIVEGFQDYVNEYAPALISGSERIETMVGESE